MTDKKEYAQQRKGETENTRRKFLKKAVYSAPVLIALGQMVKPTDVHADSSVSGNPADTGDTGGWSP